MALPRHILQSATFPRVTHARATHDYGHSQTAGKADDNTEQWASLGVTGLLYWALGLIPFKDDFWSELSEPGNAYKSTEADPELQTLVSALSGGPVGPADGMGDLNKTRVMQTCRADGVLLKPLAPAVNLDSTFTAALAAAFAWSGPGSAGDGPGSEVEVEVEVGAPPQMNGLGLEHVWGTTLGPAATTTNGPPGIGGNSIDGSSIGAGSSMYHALLFANVSAAAGYTVDVAELEAIESSILHGKPSSSSSSSSAASSAAAAAAASSSSSSSYVAREFYSGELRVVDGATPLHVQHAARPSSCASGGYDDDYCSPFELWTLAPVLASTTGWLLLGELDKYVAISPQRFQHIASGRVGADGSQAVALLTGAPGEIVALGLLDCSTGGGGGGGCTSADLPSVSKVACTLGSDGTATLTCAADTCSC